MGKTYKPKPSKKGKKAKAQDEGFWQVFEDTLEHMRSRTGIVVLTLDRLTGCVDINHEMSNPVEAWGMLSNALDKSAAEVMAMQGIEAKED